MWQNFTRYLPQPLLRHFRFCNILLHSIYDNDRFCLRWYAESMAKVSGKKAFESDHPRFGLIPRKTSWEGCFNLPIEMNNGSAFDSQRFCLIISCVSYQITTCSIFRLGLLFKCFCQILSFVTLERESYDSRVLSGICWMFFRRLTVIKVLQYCNTLLNWCDKSNPRITRNNSTSGAMGHLLQSLICSRAIVVYVV